MTPDKKLLLDVGGTFIKCSDGRQVPIDSAGDREAICASLRQAIGDATELSVAIPGPFDYANGVFLMKHKFAAVFGENLVTLTGLPVKTATYEHDVIAMLKGEMAVGNGRGFRRVALMTLGTGLGFALSIDGTVLRNATGSPLVPIYNLPFRDGILEDYASKRGMYRLYDSEALTVKEIGEKAVQGDSRAIDAFRQMGTILGGQIVNILRKYEIECVLMGGQISKNGQLFIPAMEEQFKNEWLNVRISPISDFDNATFNGLKTL